MAGEVPHPTQELQLLKPTPLDKDEPQSLEDFSVEATRKFHDALITGGGQRMGNVVHNTLLDFISWHQRYQDMMKAQQAVAARRARGTLKRGRKLLSQLNKKGFATVSIKKRK